MPGTRLYVGNLPKDRAVERNELEDGFDKFGRVVDVWVARQPPGFAFVTMESEADAEDAVKEMDGAKLCGERIRVEVSKGGEPRGGGGRGGGGRGGRDRSRSRGGGRGRSRSRGRGGDRRGGGRKRSPSYSDYSDYSGSRSRSRGRGKKRGGGKRR
eukprot:TRINITY_DN3305_c0_g1_i1.p1 TRINITY_DN3305_c0_g1~~TRINITY_DN3305_c0_g1_i1.p1  ORF type:complete len:156 (-),score=35.20 TRINITY_DN3305_c0_g1_i1:366-833(-)